MVREKSNSSTVDIMVGGTTEQCFNAGEGENKEGERTRERERETGKPAAHSPKDTHSFLSVRLTQHPGGRGG